MIQQQKTHTLITLSIYSLTYLYQYWPMVSYSLLSLFILMLILSQIWPVWTPSVGLLCPFDMCPSFFDYLLLSGTMPFLFADTLLITLRFSYTAASPLLHPLPPANMGIRFTPLEVCILKPGCPPPAPTLTPALP